MKRWVNVASWIFWGLGIAGYIGLDLPYLTDDGAFLFLQGNRLEGGWGFNYAMVVALGLTVVGFFIPKRTAQEEIPSTQTQLDTSTSEGETRQASDRWRHD